MFSASVLGYRALLACTLKTEAKGVGWWEGVPPPAPEVAESLPLEEGWKSSVKVKGGRGGNATAPGLSQDGV